MSVKTELGELFKWISELLAEEAAEPTHEPLSREVWQAVNDDLGRASTKFGEACDAILTQHPQSYVAEFARDLAREAEGLALRAHMLSRRAKPKPKPKPKRKPEPKPEPAEPEHVPPADEAVASGGRSAVEQQRAGTAATPDDGPSFSSSADLVRSAAGTVETAHRRLVVEHPDAATKGFEDELDVLAEMTLSLRQQCERLDDEPKGAQTRQKRGGWLARLMEP